MLDKVLNIIPLDIVCLMETCAFPKDRALVNVQILAFCVRSNAEEKYLLLSPSSGHVDMC